MFSKIRAAFLVIAVTLALNTPATAEDKDLVGKVTRLQKIAFAMQDALPRPLAVGSDVFGGDVISTGKGARVEVEMSDGTVMTLGERTVMVVQEWLFEQSEASGTLRLLQGAFAVSTGKITQLANAQVNVETEIATIGIRGTKFWGGELKGTFEVALLGGKGVFVETKKGRVELITVGQGTAVTSKDAAPSTPTTWPADKVSRAVDTVKFE